MSLIIDLPPDVERRLNEESRRKGLAASELARQVIETAFPKQEITEEQRARNKRAIELRRQLREQGDALNVAHLSRFTNAALWHEIA